MSFSDTEENMDDGYNRKVYFNGYFERMQALLQMVIHQTDFVCTQFDLSNINRSRQSTADVSRNNAPGRENVRVRFAVPDESRGSMWTEASELDENPLSTNEDEFIDKAKVVQVLDLLLEELSPCDNVNALQHNDGNADIDNTIKKEMKPRIIQRKPWTFSERQPVDPDHDESEEDVDIDFPPLPISMDWIIALLTVSVIAFLVTSMVFCKMLTVVLPKVWKILGEIQYPWEFYQHLLPYRGFLVETIGWVAPKTN